MKSAGEFLLEVRFQFIDTIHKGEEISNEVVEYRLHTASIVILNHLTKQ